MRLRRLEEEFPASLSVQWRSFLLRPEPGSMRSLATFRAYTRSWLRPAAESDAGTFRVWEGEAGPPSHSVPPHVVAKAAATLGSDAFRRMHERLLAAYFAENRDITDTATLRALWHEAELDPAAFARTEDPELRRRTFDEHDEALEHGVTGVPAVRMLGNDAVLVGAYPLELYRRWINKALGTT